MARRHRCPCNRAEQSADNRVSTTGPSLSFDRALANGLVIGLGRAYYLTLRTLYVFLLVQAIGLQRYGEYSFAQSWYLLLMPLAAWGGNELLISGFLMRAPDDRPRFVGTALLLRAGTSALAALLISAAAMLIEPIAELRLLILIYASGLVTRSLTGWFAALFTARGRSGLWIRWSVCLTTLEVILVLAAAHRGADLLVIATLQTALWALVMVAAYAVHAICFEPVRPAWNRELAWSLLVNGASLGSATFLYLSLAPGLLLVYRYTTADMADFGSVALVLQIFLLAQQVLTGMLNALLASLRPMPDSDNDSLQVFARSSLRLAVVAGSTVALGALAAVLLAFSISDRSTFQAALELLSGYAWLIVPIMVVQCLRIVVLSVAAYPAFLRAVGAGFILGMLFLPLARLLVALDAQTVFQAMTAALLLMVLLLGRATMRRLPPAQGPSEWLPLGALVLVLLCFAMQPPLHVALLAACLCALLSRSELRQLHAAMRSAQAREREALDRSTAGGA